MHQAGPYLHRIITPKPITASSACNYVLSSRDTPALQRALHVDAVSYYEAALLSFAEAVNALDAQRFTWSTVKLYYSAFYAIRSYLALGDICLFYVGSTGIGLKCAPGELGKKTNETTHKSVFKLFRQHLPSDPLLSQKIALEEPLDWLAGRREEANYKRGTFYEPDFPSHFSRLEQYSIRDLLNSYVADDVLSFAFDGDHAMIAYPLECLRSARQRFTSRTLSAVSEEKADVAKSYCRDKKGELTSVLHLLL